jgi:hypothetical protein
VPVEHFRDPGVVRTAEGELQARVVGGERRLKCEGREHDLGDHPVASLVPEPLPRIPVADVGLGELLSSHERPGPEALDEERAATSGVLHDAGDALGERPVDAVGVDGYRFTHVRISGDAALGEIHHGSYALGVAAPG